MHFCVLFLEFLAAHLKKSDDKLIEYNIYEIDLEITKNARYSL
jgi:hypothetical protein